MNHPIYPEYELILSTKLKNSLIKLAKDMNLEYSFKNISINGQKRGCSGFVRNPSTNTTVYISTEPIYCGFLRRYAKDMKDYGGIHSINHFSKSLSQLASDVYSMLQSPVIFSPYPRKSN